MLKHSFEQLSMSDDRQSMYDLLLASVRVFKLEDLSIEEAEVVRATAQRLSEWIREERIAQGK